MNSFFSRMKQLFLNHCQAESGRTAARPARAGHTLRRHRLWAGLWIGLLSLGLYSTARAQTQIDITGPAGSGSFGGQVTPLPNGNFVVADPGYDEGGLTNIGAVYLYDGATQTVISTLKGSTANDGVGSFGVTVLTNGNYVVRSPNWDNPAGNANVGAVTWGNGTTGIVGLVTVSNSLIGSTASDQVGNTGVTALANGNYLVRSANWDNPSVATDAGAATWGNGNGGTVGTVSASNSLVGGTASDNVSNNTVVALANGNYLVLSTNWDDPAGPVTNARALTYGNGTSGATTGLITAANSVRGTIANGISNPGFSLNEERNYLLVGRSPSNIVSLLFYNTVTATTTGLFTTGANWDNGTGPTGLDTAVIPANLTTTASTVAAAGLVRLSGTLNGTGTVTGNLRALSGSTVAPGTSPGQLSVIGNVTLNSGATLAIETDGVTVGTEYDQLKVNGTVTLNSPTLTLTNTTAGLPFGTTFTIIDNDGTDAIVGTFNGLAEGDLIPFGAGRTVGVSYVGGTGNDVTLTVLGPTAEGVSLSGQVRTSSGRAVRQALVILTDVASGERWKSYTDERGNFAFRDVEAGRGYVVRVEHPRYPFAAQFVFVGGSLSNLVFESEGRVLGRGASESEVKPK